MKKFSIMMMTITSVASIRNLPAAAFFGPHLVFFFLFGALFFLLPAALVSAELATTWPEKGGIFSWTQKAFGSPWGFLAIWFQWIANVLCYPIALSFFAGTIAYLFDEHAALSHSYLFGTILSTYWLITLINLFGIRFSSRLSDWLGSLGLFIPFCAILSLGIFWALTQPLQISLKEWIPSFDFSLLTPLTGIMLGYCGIEIATIHAPHSAHRDYPRALLFASFAITAIFILGSLSIAVIVPHERLSMISGVMQAFSEVPGLPFFCLLVALGSFAGMSNWTLAIATGLSAAAQEGYLPLIFRKENRFGSPYPILIAQGIIVTLFSSAFIFMPTVNSSFWILTTLSSQFYMVMYMLLFATALKLKKMGLISGIGWLASLFAFCMGFFPPKEIAQGNAFFYESFLIIGLIGCSIPPLVAGRRLTRFSQMR